MSPCAGGLTREFAGDGGWGGGDGGARVEELSTNLHSPLVVPFHVETIHVLCILRCHDGEPSAEGTRRKQETVRGRFT